MFIILVDVYQYYFVISLNIPGTHAFYTICYVHALPQSISNSGILRDKTMDDKLMYIPNHGKKRILVEKFGTNQSNSWQVPKVLGLGIRKSDKKTFGTSVIYSPRSPSVPDLSKT